MELKVRTLVEFFSERILNNVLGSLWLKPERLVLVIDEADVGGAVYQSTLRIMKRRLPDTAVEMFHYDKLEKGGARKTLDQLCQRYDDCVFDFTGGSELVLIAAFSLARQKNVPMLHIDINEGYCTNINGCEEYASRFEMPQLSLEDFLAANGAHLVGYGHMTPKKENYGIVLDLCRLIIDHPTHWKEQCLYMQMASAKSDELTVTSSTTLMTATHYEVKVDLQFLCQIARTGALTHLQVEGDTVTFTYKSEVLRRILCDSGTWLELLLFIVIEHTGRFFDVRLSPRIGWGGEGDVGKPYNEIDIVACAGIIPVFISCKTGLPSNDDLNQIFVYAKKFGGETARSVIVTSREIGDSFSGLVERTRELGTLLVDRRDIVGGKLGEILTGLLQ